MSLLSQGSVADADDDVTADADDEADDNDDADAACGADDDDEFDNLKHCQLRLTNSLNVQHQQRGLKGLHQITQIGQLRL